MFMKRVKQAVHYKQFALNFSKLVGFTTGFLSSIYFVISDAYMLH